MTSPGRAFTITDIFRDNREGSRSFNNETDFFYREAMGLVPPLEVEELPDMNEVAAAMKEIIEAPGSNRLSQFIANLQATSVQTLWPGCNSPPPTAPGLAFEAAQSLLTPKTYTPKRKRPSKPTSIKGRKSGSQNWKKDETEALLTILNEVLPSRNEQWEDISSRLRDAGFVSRDAQACKLKFNKLYSAGKGLADGLVPRHVAIAKEIRSKISDVDVICISADNVSSDGLSGAIRPPNTKKRKLSNKTKAVEKHGKAAKLLCDGMKDEMIDDIDNDSISNLDKHMDSMESKIISKLENKIESMESNIISKLENMMASMESRMNFLETKLETKIDAILIRLLLGNNVGR